MPIPEPEAGMKRHVTTSGNLDIRLGSQLALGWRSADGKITKFLRDVGLTGEEHHQALYIYPQHTANAAHSIEQIRIATANDNRTYYFLAGKHGGKDTVFAWPVADRKITKNTKKILLALYVDIHSRLVGWWLTNAWRSEQLARATWALGDSGQIVPAAACARSLLETAAAFWVDSQKLSELWQSIKVETAEQGPKVDHWHSLTKQIFQMMWGSKFDDKVPDWTEFSKILPRTNVLGLIEKLQRATSDTLQQDYQWLCNVVHPSVGSMLAFAAPMVMHDTKSHGFQFVAPFATTHVASDGKISAEVTIEQAVARSAALAVDVLFETLDASLRIVDDVGLTTGAPEIASFNYWRMVSQKSRNALCPCRSGRKAKNCRHGWADDSPKIAEQFGR
jgi:hypothetical protein